jgi:hypothetical protein
VASVDTNGKTTLDVLHLGPRVRSALESAGVKTLSDLTALRSNDLLRKKNIGRKALQGIREALHQHGLFLRDQNPDGVKNAHEQALIENLAIRKAQVIGEARRAAAALKGPHNPVALVMTLAPMCEAVDGLDAAEKALVEFRSGPTLTEIYESGPQFFQWVAECCTLLGKPREFGENLMPEKDISWWACFDDGMTPEAAVAEYKAKVPEKEQL